MRNFITVVETTTASVSLFNLQSSLFIRVVTKVLRDICIVRDTRMHFDPTCFIFRPWIIRDKNFVDVQINI